MRTIQFIEYLVYCIYNKLVQTTRNDSNVFNDLILNALNNGWNVRKVNNKIIIQKNNKKKII
jgi:hypothetical protein